MHRTTLNLTLGLLLCAVSQAATINTTLTVTSSGAFNTSGGIDATGTATLTNGIGSGTFKATLSLTGVSGSNYVAPFTITLSGSAGTITGNILIPTSLVTAALAGTASSGNFSATVTGGTGTYAGATGSFPTLAGSLGGSVLTGLTLSFSGAGTVVTAGTGGGGGGGATGPAVTEVLDAGSYTKNIAQGSIFVVKGSNLSASGYTPMSFPLPTSNSGVKITLTPASGGTGTDAFLVYLYNQGGVNQLAAVMPSTLAVGSYNLTVTNGTATSAPVAVSIVQRKLGLITADSSGSGLAAILNYTSATTVDYDRFTTFSSGGYNFSPAKPGQVLVAWGTGMGPVTGGDNVASPGFDFAANGLTVRVIVGGMTITPAYAGRAPGLAGADQINFQLPANVPTGCSVSFQISVNGVLTPPTFIAIAPNASADACVQPGFTTDQLKQFDGGATYTLGSFGLNSISLTVPDFGTVKSNSISGGFYQFSGFQINGSSQYSYTPNDSCIVIPPSTATTGGDATCNNVRGLDAGAITLTGPSASGINNLTVKQIEGSSCDPSKPSYSYGQSLGTEGISIPGQPNYSVPAGQYSLKGAGGKDIGSFTAQITSGGPLTVTGGLPTTVNRSAGLTLNWTGGNSSDIVEIFGAAGTTSDNTTSFVCFTTAGKGTFTVPSSILTQLPAVSASSTTGASLLEIISSINPTNGNGLFTAPLTAGGSINIGTFIALSGTGNTPTYQ